MSQASLIKSMIFFSKTTIFSLKALIFGLMTLTIYTIKSGARMAPNMSATSAPTLKPFTSIAIPITTAKIDATIITMLNVFKARCEFLDFLILSSSFSCFLISLTSALLASLLTCDV